MKKALFLCVALIGFMTVNAEITQLSCKDAKTRALALPNDNEPEKDSVAVTGYVTFTNGTVSSGQQTFWMDDEKGTTQTFQAYWANIPAGETALNVGDKVTIKGFLMKYKTTPEMKNPTTIILERAIVDIDTIPATVCEAIEEGSALKNGDVTADVFTIVSVVTSVTELSDSNKKYGNQTFFMECDDNEKTLQAYNVTMKDTVYAALGDTVEVMGKLTMFNGQVEITGKAQVLAKGNVKIDTIAATCAEAVAAGMLIDNNKTSVDVYVVTGYVDSIAYSFSEKNKNMSFYMCDDINNPTYDFEAYKAKTETDIPVGTQVRVTGRLKHYYKAATDSTTEINLIETENCTTEILSASGWEKINVENGAVKFFQNGQLYIRKDNQLFDVKGVQVL